MHRKSSRILENGALSLELNLFGNDVNKFLSVSRPKLFTFISCHLFHTSACFSSKYRAEHTKYCKGELNQTKLNIFVLYNDELLAHIVKEENGEWIVFPINGVSLKPVHYKFLSQRSSLISKFCPISNA